MGIATKSLCCEISIIQAKNLELKSHGNLFVRYYLCSRNNKRIQLNTQEISSKSKLFWNESFSLECLGTQDSINNLKQESVVFELRWRNTNSILGKLGGSQLLGRAEISWKSVLESPKMEINEKWVMMVPKKNCSSVLDDDVKPPSVQIAMKVRVPEIVKLKKWENDGCGCCNDGGCKCQDYEMFALVGAFETL